MSSTQASLPPQTTPMHDPTMTPTTTVDGPLRSLAHKAASSHLVRRARETVPTFASDAVDSTASKADAVLHRVDTKLVAAGKTLETDEGKQWVSAAAHLCGSFFAFAVLSFTALLSFAESALGVEHAAEKPPIGKRTKRVAKVTASKVSELFERRERQAQGTPQAAVYAKSRWLGGVVLAVSTCVFCALKQYSGPAKEYINPMAEKVLSVLPEERASESEPAVPAKTKTDET